MNKKTTLALITGAALLGGAAAGLVGVASAQTMTPNAPLSTQAPKHFFGRHGRGGMMGHDVRGTVSAVNGSTITITSKNGTTYTVDAASAKLSKVVDITTADVKVGDVLNAAGTISGTTVTAKHILDGVPVQSAQ